MRTFPLRQSAEVTIALALVIGYVLLLAYFISERFSPSWQTVLFGPPEQGIDALRSEGLNYFFFSIELPMTKDPLAISAIFSPDEIGKHLVIRWTDGTNYLLTWPNEQTQPITEKFLAAYRYAVKTSSGVEFSQATHLEKISDYLTTRMDFVHSVCLG
jgi:hypothetical protein